jgi:hypothetical protein
VLDLIFLKVKFKIVEQKREILSFLFCFSNLQNEKEAISISNQFLSELHRLLMLSKPSHPLIALINHSDVSTISDENKEDCF